MMRILTACAAGAAYALAVLAALRGSPIPSGPLRVADPVTGPQTAPDGHHDATEAQS